MNAISASTVTDSGLVFEKFRTKLYELGIYVFKDAFKDNAISGLCINDDQYPIIIVNNSMSFSRQIFTLFHELYHLISNTSGVEIIRDDYLQFLRGNDQRIEKRCDEFANAFLVPIDDFVIELEKEALSPTRIEELANLYSVSREAIMYKLLQMKRITSEEYSALKEEFYSEAIRNKKKSSNTTDGGNYYSTKLAYLGSKYTGDVVKQYKTGKIDSVKASEMLNIKIDHLPRVEATYFRRMRA